MTTTVFSIAPLIHKKPALICQLQDTTPDLAIERLEKAGVLAIAGPEPNSIVLVGFDYEVSHLLMALRRFPSSYRINEKLKRFSLVS